MDALRWGILSTADIARTKVVPGMRKARRCDIVAIASREAERAERVAVELGIPRAHASYEALLADPQVDAVYIPLPNHLHAEWSIAAARAVEFGADAIAIAVLKREQAEQRGNGNGHARGGNTRADGASLPFFHRKFKPGHSHSAFNASAGWSRLARHAG
jgi:hypothetical protein